jgi:signal transduction histidine kinase/CheY-like chemotaxis protein
MTFAYAIIVLLAVACMGLFVAYRRACSRECDLATQVHDAAEIAQLHIQTLTQRNQLDSVKDEFISTVSHELRTPLTSIRGALGLLSAGMLGDVDPKAQNLLRIASTNTDRLVRLINDILDLERMDSGRSPLQHHNCSLRELIVQAVETMTPMADTAGVHIDIVPEPSDEAIMFDGDPDRVLQVFCNLLSNAIKFSDPGHPIRLSSRTDGPELVLSIEDSGRGIPADQLETVFDRFKQVDPGDSRQKGGTGLGLAICRSIVIQHGGTIYAQRNDSTVHGMPGTTFTLRLPRLLSRAPAHKPLPSAGAILVCDDDASIRHIVAEQLRRHGYTVLEADSGEQVLQLAKNHEIDAILLDLYMPGLTGWDTMDQLKLLPATAAIPIIVLSVLSPTARSASGDPLVSSAQGWVQKPFNETLLIAELGRVLRRGSGPGRILLVEDDPDLVSVILSGFENNAGTAPGLLIQHVSTIEDARKICTKTPPDVLILDLSLPDGSGISLVEWLRRQPDLNTLSLVVYSARPLTEKEMDNLRLGPTQFLTKAHVQPRDLEDLVLSMIRHLRTPGYSSIPA